MAPEVVPGFEEACRRLCPSFRAVAERIAARKSQLLPGIVDGQAVIAKRLAAPNGVWAWYLAREIAIYRSAVDLPMPRLVAASEDILIIERAPGQPLGRRRDPRAELSPAIVGELLALRQRIAETTCAWPDLVPPPAVRSQLRSRLLEDPTAPLEWVQRGVARCGSRGTLERRVAERIGDALADHPAIAPSHGDLMLRNIVGDGTRITLVDWECAGLHALDWDVALLWTQLAPGSREPIEAAVRTTSARWRCFLGLVAFALVREISFLLAFRTRADHPGLVRRRAELVVVGDRLLSAGDG